MKLIWHGTASIEIVNQYGRILFDPFVPLKHSDVPVTLQDFDGFTDIFITHGHLDHIVNLPEIVSRNPEVKIYCTKTPFQTLIRKGISKQNLTQLSFGQILNVNGFTIHILHGLHALLPTISLSRISYMLKSPARENIPYLAKENHRCKENNETVFYQIEADGQAVSLIGSLNLREEIQYPMNADVLILPYNGWDNNYPPAVRVINKLHPKRVLLDHYDNTFPPLTSPLDLSPILNYGDGTITAMKLNKTERV